MDYLINGKKACSDLDHTINRLYILDIRLSNVCYLFILSIYPDIT